MSSPTNLTGRITHLRQRRKPERLVRTRSPRPPGRAGSERKMAHDPFLILAYSLLAAAAATQLGLIVWLDLL